MQSLAPPLAVDPSDASPPSRVQLVAAFNTFAREHAERVEFWMKRLRVPEVDAEDLLQEALLAMWVRRHDLPDDLSAWLGTTVALKNKHRLRRYARWGKREPLFRNRVATSLPPASATPDVVLEHRQLLAKVARFMGELAPERREVMSRYLVQNEPMAAIAASLGVPLDTVKTRWRLAKEDIDAAFARERAKERSRLVALVAFLFAFVWRLLRRAVPSALVSEPLAPREASWPRAHVVESSRWVTLAAVGGLAALCTGAVSHQALGALAPLVASEDGIAAIRVAPFSLAFQWPITGLAVRELEAGSPSSAARARPSNHEDARMMLVRIHAALDRGDKSMARHALRLYRDTFKPDPFAEHHAALWQAANAP